MGMRTVLFVDDEENILRSLRRSLIDEPYVTIFANSGKRAIEMLRQEEVHVVVTDLHMPDIEGLALLEIIKEEYPRAIRLVFSGDAATDNLLEAINNGQIFRFITKPLKSSGELKTIIRQAIEYYDLYSERNMLMVFFEQLVDGKEPEEINLQYIKRLISSHRRRISDWNEECSLTPVD